MPHLYHYLKYQSEIAGPLILFSCQVMKFHHNNPKVFARWGATEQIPLLVFEIYKRMAG